MILPLNLAKSGQVKPHHPKHAKSGQVKPHFTTKSAKVEASKTIVPVHTYITSYLYNIIIHLKDELLNSIKPKVPSGKSGVGGGC